MDAAMPVTILSSDLAFAPVEGGRLVLRFEGDREPRGFVVTFRDGEGRPGPTWGPFEHEDEALADARRRHGALTWSSH